MKKVILVLLFYPVITVTLSQNPTYQQKLFYSCKVWGFVKYYHSAVSTCQVNWDSVLTSTLPAIKNAVSNTEFNDALASMISASGPMAIATTPTPDTLPMELKRNLNFGWINNPVFRNDIKVMLDTIKNNFRPHAICWVHMGNATSGFLDFPYDNPVIDSNLYSSYPTEFNRLLLFFKYWNILNYFNPYNYVQDTPWDSTLYNNLLVISDASDYAAFFKTIKKITANCNDAHVEGLTYSTSYNMYGGNYCPKIVLRYSENSYVVVKSGIGSISKGDIIVSVDGKTTIQWEDSLRPYISAGNPSVFRRSMCQNLLRGAGGSQIHLVFKDSTGNNQVQSLTRNYPFIDDWIISYYPNDTLRTVRWKKWNCNVGYANMGTLLSHDVDSMYYVFRNTTAIIFDIRNYPPDNTAWDIATFIYPNKMCFSKATRPNTSYPGTFLWSYDYLGYNGNPLSYAGKVIILCNQQTQSAAEYSCMILGAMPNSVIVGSQTAGADGNVSKFHLSQDIHTGFTNIGIYYPNGDSTQRIGIVPDSIVYITPQGVRNGRDEVLEKALQVAGCLTPILAITPPSQNVASTADTTVFIITSNTNWAAVSDAAWCTVTHSGSGNGTILASFTENISYQKRVANIHITVAGLPEQIITVIQAKSTLGVDEPIESSYRVSPNPTNGLFRIIPAEVENGTLDVGVQDLNGTVILKRQCRGEKDYWIDLSSAAKGIYYITMKTDKNLVVQKLIIH